MKQITLSGRTSSIRKAVLISFLALTAVLAGRGEARAQWTTSGNNISNTNTGGVGVGTSTPGELFHVAGNVRVGSAPITLTKVNDADGITTADTALTVDSTASYPPAGTLFLEQEVVTYTAKTATTFTGLTRGLLTPRPPRTPTGLMSTPTS